MDNIIIYLISPIILSFIQYLFLKICKDFQANKKIIYLIPIILSYIPLFFSRDLRIYDIGLAASYMLMLNYSISDILYREVDAKSYYFLLPFIAINLFAMQSFLSNALSLVTTFVLMFFYWLLGNKFSETMGGGDMKFFILLSMYYPFDYVFMFLLYSMFFTIILGIICIIKEKNTKASIPMIVSISIGHIFISFCYLMLEKHLFVL